MDFIHSLIAALGMVLSVVVMIVSAVSFVSGGIGAIVMFSMGALYLLSIITSLIWLYAKDD